MKKILITLAIALTPLMANAEVIKIGGSGDSTVLQLENSNGLTYNATYDIPVSAYNGNRIGSAITYSFPTFSAKTFSTNTITMDSANITIASHGWTVGLPVLLTETAGTVPGPLTAETTYYAIPYSANVIQLATTSAQAIAGDPIILLSSSTTGTQTYTLTPLAIEGNPVFTYQGTNDGTYFFSIGVSSTIVNNTPETTWAHDIGEYNYSGLRLSVTAPTANAVKIKATVNLKK